MNRHPIGHPDEQPVVLHVVRDLVRPSEGFVADLVGSCRRTRPVVAFGRGWPTSVRPAGVPSHDLHLLAGGGAGDADRPAARRAVRAALGAVTVGRRAALLHAHFGYWAAHAGRVAARTHRPWALSLHGHDLLVADRDRPEAAVLRTADLVAAPSGWFADRVADAGFPESRIRVLPSGVDLSALPFSARAAHDGPVTVSFAGRFVEKKAPLDALAALAVAAGRLAAESGPQLRAVFVGTGPLEAQLRAAVAGLGGELTVDIRDGAVPGAVRRALAETDLAIVPSRTAADGDAETLGLVAIEAQALGVPVVATRHGGLPDTVGAGAGVLVREGDVDELAAAVADLARRPAAWAEMGRAGRCHVEQHFELGACTARVEDAYLDLIAAN